MCSSDLGSTAISERMDPEDLREIIAAYRSTVTRAIERYEGYVARYLGDGLLVYFGYPRAHEDDAERAVLRIAEEVTSGPGASAEAIAQLKDHFDPAAIVELVLTASFYVCVGRVLLSMDIELEQGVQ